MKTCRVCSQQLRNKQKQLKPNKLFMLQFIYSIHSIGAHAGSAQARRHQGRRGRGEVGGLLRPERGGAERRHRLRREPPPARVRRRMNYSFLTMNNFCISN